MSTVVETAVPSAMLPVVSSIFPRCCTHHCPSAPSPVSMTTSAPARGSHESPDHGSGASTDAPAGSAQVMVASTHHDPDSASGCPSRIPDVIRTDETGRTTPSTVTRTLSVETAPFHVPALTTAAPTR